MKNAIISKLLGLLTCLLLLAGCSKDELVAPASPGTHFSERTIGLDVQNVTNSESRQRGGTLRDGDGLDDIDTISDDGDDESDQERNNKEQGG